jgi:hypothetical protein
LFLKHLHKDDFLHQSLIREIIGTEGAVLEHHAIFVNALRGGHEIRKRIFDVIEQHHANDFRGGREGVELYEELLFALRNSGMPDVVKEFERRFAPLLNPDPPRGSGKLGPQEKMTDKNVLAAVRGRRRWGRMAMLSVAAFVGTFIIAVGILRMTATERTVTAATIPSAKAAEPVSEATTDPVPSTEQQSSLEE